MDCLLASKVQLKKYYVWPINSIQSASVMKMGIPDISANAEYNRDIWLQWRGAFVTCKLKLLRKI